MAGLPGCLRVIGGPPGCPGIVHADWTARLEIASDLRKLWCAILGLNQTGLLSQFRSRGREPAPYLGTIWDHTLCAMVNDPRVL